MLIPERMSKVSIICLQKDLDAALNAIGSFGSFHIEYPKDENRSKIIESLERTSARINALIRNLEVKESGLALFRAYKKEKMRVYVEDWLRLSEDIEREVSEIESEVNGELNEIREIDLRIADLQEKRKILGLISRFNIDPKVVAGLRLISVFIATVSSRHMLNLVRAFSHLPVIYHFEEIGGERAFLFVAFMKRNSQTIRKILETYDAEIFPILKDIELRPSEEIIRIERQLEEQYASREEALKRLRRLSERYGDRLLSLREMLWNAQNFLKTKYALQKTRRLTRIVGYTPTSSLRELEDHLERALNGRFIILSDERIAGGDPPTILSNPKIIKPFEIITRLYGLPSYDEVDPTPFIAISFPLIFGLMFGDLGHGLILFLGSLLFYFIVKVPEEWRNFSKILAACGLGATLAGILFGEAFGRRIFTPLWMDPFENIISFLIFSVFIGIIHIMSGLILRMVNLIIRREYIDVLTVSFPSILLYGLIVFFLMDYKLNLNLWFSGPIYLVAAAFALLILGKPVLVMLLKSEDTIRVFGERIFEGGELTLSFISNTASYTRILALLMTHWALLKSTYAISDLVSATSFLGGIIATLIVVGGNIFVIAFEGLVVFIHTLRLHFYEWFSKFYEGMGMEFQPFKYHQRFVEILYSSIR